MANENLFETLPADIERVDLPGPFFLKKFTTDGDGGRCIVVLTETLVTCGGHPEGAERARRIANGMNRAWHELCAQETARQLIETGTVDNIDAAYAQIENNPHLAFLTHPSS